MQTFLSLLKIMIFVDVKCLARSQTNPLEARAEKIEVPCTRKKLGSNS